jgi:hypothetical protein
MNIYNIEVTDLFAGNLNYSWVRRYSTTARSLRGAIQKLSRHTGAYHRIHDSYGDDWAVYHDIHGAVGVHIAFTDCIENQKGEEI